MGVLRYVALGWDVPNIAAELELSPHTVRTHLANVRSKLGVRQRVQPCVVVAARLGLLGPSASSWT